MKEHDVDLGMDSAITRRDFLQGVALGAAALGLRGKARASTPGPSDSPPERGGLQGQNPAGTALGHRVRDEETGGIRDVVETGEDYDLVVVGAGIAGLGAAFLYDREARGKPKILLLDNHDDFGGHARRNVMEYEGARLVAPGGTFALEDVDDSPDEALEVFRRIGLDPARLVEYRDEDFEKRFGLSQAVAFDSRVYPDAKTTWVTGWYDTPYDELFARAPIGAQARRELVTLYTTRKNYLPGADDLEDELARLSWEAFIRDRMGLGDEAVRFCNLYATDLIGLGCDAVSALAGYWVGPGFYGMGGEGFYEANGILRYGYEPVHRYPDGNHTIARHLLKAIVPEAVPGPDTMEGVFESRVRYDELDTPARRIRLRLQSMVVRIAHRGSEAVHVNYVQPDGKLRRVTAKHVIMTGWGSVAKHVVPELSEEQREALEAYGYCSALYINVLLKHWRPIADIGAFEMFWPDGYCTWMHVSDPLHVGAYRPEYHPDRPTILSMYKYLYRPGLDVRQQMQLGRYEMEQKRFEDYEREIRRELNHVLGPWGFDARRDIAGITVNRWGHGYNFFDFPGETGRPYRRGRERMGRISFAGADAGGTPWTQASLAQAWRAVNEQLAL